MLGVARRLPARADGKTEWARADITTDELAPLVRGADAVVHLAWAIQPSRDLAELRRTNVDGSARVFRAVADAGVPALVHASSVGAYSPGPKDRFVDESWPSDGIPTSFYSRHKAEVERLLDRFEQEHPSVRSVRLRPALIFKRESAEEQRRLFAGPFLPSALVRRGLIPFVPDVPRLRFQVVHSYDVGEAYRLAATGDARGAFNVAADPGRRPRRARAAAARSQGAGAAKRAARRDLADVEASAAAVAAGLDRPRAADAAARRVARTERARLVASVHRRCRRWRTCCAAFATAPARTRRRSSRQTHAYDEVVQTRVGDDE